jgi:hypothetical protein
LPDEEQDDKLEEDNDKNDVMKQIAAYVPTTSLRADRIINDKPLVLCLTCMAQLDHGNTTRPEAVNESDNDDVDAEIVIEKQFIKTEINSAWNFDTRIQCPGEVATFEIENDDSNNIEYVIGNLLSKCSRLNKLDIYNYEAVKTEFDNVSASHDLVEAFELDPAYDYKRNIVAQSRFSHFKDFNKN